MQIGRLRLSSDQQCPCSSSKEAGQTTDVVSNPDQVFVDLLSLIVNSRHGLISHAKHTDDDDPFKWRVRISADFLNKKFESILSQAHDLYVNNLPVYVEVLVTGCIAQTNVPNNLETCRNCCRIVERWSLKKIPRRSAINLHPTDKKPHRLDAFALISAIKSHLNFSNLNSSLALCQDDQKMETFCRVVTLNDSVKVGQAQNLSRFHSRSLQKGVCLPTINSDVPLLLTERRMFGLCHVGSAFSLCVDVETMPRDVDLCQLINSHGSCNTCSCSPLVITPTIALRNHHHFDNTRLSEANDDSIGNPELQINDNDNDNDMIDEYAPLASSSSSSSSSSHTAHASSWSERSIWSNLNADSLATIVASQNSRTCQAANPLFELQQRQSQQNLLASAIPANLLISKPPIRCADGLSNWIISPSSLPGPSSSLFGCSSLSGVSSCVPSTSSSDNIYDFSKLLVAEEVVMKENDADDQDEDFVQQQQLKRRRQQQENVQFFWSDDDQDPHGRIVTSTVCSNTIDDCTTKHISSTSSSISTSRLNHHQEEVEEEEEDEDDDDDDEQEEEEDDDEENCSPFRYSSMCSLKMSGEKTSNFTDPVKSTVRRATTCRENVENHRRRTTCRRNLMMEDNFSKPPSRISSDAPHCSKSFKNQAAFLLEKLPAVVRFNRKTGLPLSSSPAPLVRNKSSFDFDSSLSAISAIKSALRANDYESGSSDSDSGVPLCKSAPASSNLLGNFEECALNGRIKPFGSVDGFYLQLGASGSFWPNKITLPVNTLFFNISDDNAPSPYYGHCSLENVGKRGYYTPKKGTIQATLFNPQGTVIKMFIVKYDLSDMPPYCQTFVRQRTFFMPSNVTFQDAHKNRSWLRYLIHLRFATSKSGKLYLHTDIRMLFSRKSELDAYSNKADQQKNILQVDENKNAESFLDNFELRSFTETPKNPTYSPRKCMAFSFTNLAKKVTKK